MRILKTNCHLATLCSAGLLALLSTQASAQTPAVTQPGGLNLGNTSFFDGFSGPPGWTALSTIQYSSANKIADSKGNASPPFINPKIKSTVLVNQLSYAFSDSIGVWHPSLMTILPIVHLGSSFGPGPALKSGGTGAGDITLEAALQGRPIVNEQGKPVFSQRLALATILPTGSYDEKIDINQSSGYSSINPSWAVTVLPAPRWEFSGRLNYLYNFKNTKPASSAPRPFNGLPVTSTQAGDAAWLNFGASYSVTPELSLGINGYYFQQISNSKANGTTLSDSRERVLGVGPGLMWRINPKNALWVNAYSENSVRNRTESPLKIQARMVFNF